MTTIPENEIYDRWILLAIEAPSGEKLYITTTSVFQQDYIYKELRKAMTRYAKIDPANIARLKLRKIFRDKVHWVAIDKTSSAPLTGFRKTASGHQERITIMADPERERMLNFMKEDGFILDDVEERLGPLTPEEKEKFNE